MVENLEIGYLSTRELVTKFKIQNLVQKSKFGLDIKRKFKNRNLAQISNGSSKIEIFQILF